MQNLISTTITDSISTILEVCFDLERSLDYLHLFNYLINNNSTYVS